MILGCRVWDFASLDLGFRVRLRFRVEFGLRVWGVARVKDRGPKLLTTVVRLIRAGVSFWSFADHDVQLLRVPEFTSFFW